MARFGFWAVIAATVAVYLVMVLWSLPKVASFAGGLMPFDLRPAGYGQAEARAFLAALGDEGRAFYRGVQHRLDIAYPALMAATLILCFRRLVAHRALLAALIVVVLAAMASDYAENWLVGRMLGYPGDTAPAALIGRASFATVVKSLAGGAALTGLVALLVRAVWRKLRV
jgi:hypothetical protein